MTLFSSDSRTAKVALDTQCLSGVIKTLHDSKACWLCSFVPGFFPIASDGNFLKDNFFSNQILNCTVVGQDHIYAFPICSLGSSSVDLVCLSEC